MILVADNIRITNRTIEEALNRTNPQPIQEMVKRCETAGAHVIDINSGPLSKDPEKKMSFLVEAIQDVSDLPILIDTVNPKAIEAGLNANKNTAIINGFSLEPAKLEFILPLARRFQADIVGYLLYPNGHVPPDGAERSNIAVALFAECEKAGVDKNALIIDPVIVPVIWQNGSFQAMEVISTIRTLPELLEYNVRTIAGLSNLTAGKGDSEKKLLLEMGYLPMLLESGLSMALLDIFHHQTIRIAKACSILEDKRVFSWEELS